MNYVLPATYAHTLISFSSREYVSQIYIMIVEKASASMIPPIESKL